MAKHNLSQRQEIFCNQIFLGKTASEAAIIAGYGEYAATNTTKLLKATNVLARIDELRRLNTNGTIATVKERKEKLSEILRKPLPEQVRPRDMILAAGELNKMDGIYQLPTVPNGGFSYAELTRAALAALKDAQVEGRVLSIETQRVIARVEAKTPLTAPESQKETPQMLIEGDIIEGEEK